MDKWERYPIITKKEKLARNHRITSPFGGLIYFESGNNSTQTISVELRNVVRAPFFNLEDPNQTWDLNASAPMAEIQGMRLTMSFPSKYAKFATDPAALASFWDRVVEMDLDLLSKNPFIYNTLHNNIDFFINR
jgi:hypothetical protein